MAAAATTTISRSRPGSRIGRPLVWTLLLVLSALLSACSSCRSSHGPSPAASAKAVSLAPVPAPAGLMAELYIEKPGAAWSSVRKLVGGTANLLPAGFQMLGATMLGLQPDAAGLIDDLPVYGALVLDSQGTPRLVIGLHVRSGRELVASLSTGSKARFHAAQDKKSGVTLLEPVAGKASTDVALGVVGHYLLAARNATVLEAAGPFVARTLPTRKAPPGPIVAVSDHTALAGPVAAHIAGGWKAYRQQLEQSSRAVQAKHGHPADYADPAVALAGADSAVSGLLDVLRTTQRLTVVVDPLDGRMAARAELTPDKSGAAEELVAGMRTGPMDALSRLPGGTALALATRTDASSRQAWAHSTQSAIEKLLGERLGKPGKKKLEQTLADLAKGRGDDAAFGLAAGEGSSLVMRSTVADADAFNSGSRELFGLLRIPALVQPIEQFLGKATVSVSKTQVKGIDGSVQQAKLTPIQLGKSKIAVGPKPIRFLWTVRDGVALGSAGRNPVPGLLALSHAGSDAAASLGGDAFVAGAVKQLGHDAAFAVLVDPLLLRSGVARPGATAPMLFGFGRTGGKGWLQADVSQAAIRTVVQATMLMMRRR